MIQFFLKPSIINQNNWDIAYQRIHSILSNFPTKIIRMESYNGYSPELDKKHFDLFVDKGTDNEHLSFWGDWMSYTGQTTVRFYKNWEKQLEKEATGKEIDESKSVTWVPPSPYFNDGSLPTANGIIPLRYEYIDSEGAHYACVLMAIGTMLENLYNDNAFMTVWYHSEEMAHAVVNWLEAHFGESFNLPMFFDRKRLLNSFINDYENKKDIACRMADLYRNQHKRNMEFALENIGYKPTFDFYTEVLADTGFGTFGFSDVLMPWIAVTKDIERTLDLILASKQLLLKDKENEYNLEQADKYDLKQILKEFLNDYILWTPLQREQLEHFYTNQSALETGEEDLMGVMKRMMGYRVDICPIYCTENELFESFMYKEPKNGEAFKSIIENWLIKNKDAYKNLKEKLNQILDNHEVNKDDEPKQEVNELESLIDNYVANFKASEQYFVKKAIIVNPNYIRLDEAIAELKSKVVQIANKEEYEDYAQQVRDLSKERNIAYIRSRIKEIGYCVNPKFEDWLEAINDNTILFHLHFLMALKLYERPAHFTRFQLLWDKDKWQNWE